LLASLLFGQAEAAQPRFEVANASRSKTGAGKSSFDFRSAGAFNVCDYTISGLLPLAFQRTEAR
jgi:hypothetical protein